MEIEKEGAYGMVRKGEREVYFCSENCYNKFNSEPGKYLWSRMGVESMKLLYWKTVGVSVGLFFAVS